MKRYVGTRTAGQEWAVTVEDSTVGKAVALAHIDRHSPGGFSWGYAGSGPADLALAILADHLGWEPPEEIYQQFKDEVIAALPQYAEWRFDSMQVALWLARHLTQGDRAPTPPTT